MTARISLRILTVAALVCALLVAVAVALPAQIHADDLIEAEPAPGAVIGEEPEVILLRFDRDLALKRGAHDVEVFNQDGDRVDDGHSEIAGYSQRTMIVHLAEPVEEGEVVVLYSVRFADSGDTLEGEFDFAIEPGIEEEEAEEAVVGEPRSEESIVLWTIAVMLAIALFALMLYYLRVATDNAKSSVEEPPDSHH